MKNIWTKEEQRILDGIAAKMIEDGVPEQSARLRAEQELERRRERKQYQAEIGTVPVN